MTTYIILFAIISLIMFGMFISMVINISKIKQTNELLVNKEYKNKLKNKPIMEKEMFYDIMTRKYNHLK